MVQDLVVVLAAGDADYAAVPCATAVLDVAEYALPESMLTGRGYGLTYCTAHGVYHVYETHAAGIARQWVQQRQREIFKTIRKAEPKLPLSTVIGYENQITAGFAAATAISRQDRQRFGEWRQEQEKRAVTQRKASRRQAQVAAVRVDVNRLTMEQQVEFYRCFRKQVFVFVGQAEAALLGRPADVAAQLTVYNCEFCSGWHIGHPPRATRRSGRNFLRKVEASFRRYPEAARDFLRFTVND